MTNITENTIVEFIETLNKKYEGKDELFIYKKLKEEVDGMKDFTLQYRIQKKMATMNVIDLIGKVIRESKVKADGSKSYTTVKKKEEPTFTVLQGLQLMKANKVKVIELKDKPEYLFIANGKLKHLFKNEDGTGELKDANLTSDLLNELCIDYNEVKHSLETRDYSH